MILRLLKHPIIQNVLYMHGVRISTYIFPLITLPYLARVLGTDAFGLLSFAQSFALWLALFVEYGFSLSATRELARHREDIAKVEAIVAGVLGAKGLLLVLSIGITSVTWVTVSAFREHVNLLWWAWISAITQGLSPIWYFQGIERMRTPALLEIGGRVLVMLGILTVVKAPEDVWRALALQALGNGLELILSLTLMYKKVRFRFPTFIEVWQSLRMGFSMFLSRGAVSLVMRPSD